MWPSYVIFLTLYKGMLRVAILRDISQAIQSDASCGHLRDISHAMQNNAS